MRRGFIGVLVCALVVSTNRSASAMNRYFDFYDPARLVTQDDLEDVQPLVDQTNNQDSAGKNRRREKLKGLRHWLCSSQQLLRGSSRPGYMYRHSP